MSILLILGNGFDLKANLKTKYGDFFESRLEYYRDSIKLLDKVLLNPIKFNADELSRLIGSYYATIQTKRFTLWDWIFFLLKYSEVKSNIEWWNIEELIFNIIVKPEEKGWGGEKKDLNIYRVIYEFENIKPNSYQFQFNIDNIELKNLNRFFAVLLKTHYHQEIVQLKLNESIFELFLRELKIFESTFVDYLNRLDKDNYIKTSENLVSKLGCKNVDLYILNFNYTDPTISIKNNVEYKFKFSDNVHGNIFDNNIIFGIDQTSCLFNDNGYMFTKTARKIYSNNDNKLDRYNTVMVDDLDKIIIYGHSLNNADYSYYRSIFDHYDLYNSKIIIEYYFSIYNDSEGYDIKKTNNNRVINLFQRYGKDSGHGENLLHKLILESRLHVKVLD